MFFYGFILTSCRVSGENRQSLYSVTAASMYHGLSQMGVRILSAFGFMQPVTSLERARQKNLVLFDATVRFDSEPCNSYLILYVQDADAPGLRFLVGQFQPMIPAAEQEFRHEPT
jgi:hypothetical protein